MAARKAKTRMGRPPKEDGTAKTKTVTLRVTEAEYERFQAAAKAAAEDGEPNVSAWLRSLAEKGS